MKFENMGESKFSISTPPLKKAPDKDRGFDWRRIGFTLLLNTSCSL
jgi:hypothetical protein